MPRSFDQSVQFNWLQGSLLCRDLSVVVCCSVNPAVMNIKPEVCYIRVCEDENTPVELPLEEDSTLLLSTLTAQFPRATSLKYNSESGCMRGVKFSEGRIFPPPDGWQDRVYKIVASYCKFRFLLLRSSLFFA